MLLCRGLGSGCLAELPLVMLDRSPTKSEVGQSVGQNSLCQCLIEAKTKGEVGQSAGQNPPLSVFD